MDRVGPNCGFRDWSAERACSLRRQHVRGLDEFVDVHSVPDREHQRCRCHHMHLLGRLFDVRHGRLARVHAYDDGRRGVFKKSTYLAPALGRRTRCGGGVARDRQNSLCGWIEQPCRPNLPGCVWCEPRAGCDGRPHLTHPMPAVGARLSVLEPGCSAGTFSPSQASSCSSCPSSSTSSANASTCICNAGYSTSGSGASLSCTGAPDCSHGRCSRSRPLCSPRRRGICLFGDICGRALGSVCSEHVQPGGRFVVVHGMPKREHGVLDRVHNMRVLFRLRVDRIGRIPDLHRYVVFRLSGKLSSRDVRNAPSLTLHGRWAAQPAPHNACSLCGWYLHVQRRPVHLYADRGRRGDCMARVEPGTFMLTNLAVSRRCETTSLGLPVLRSVSLWVVQPSASHHLHAVPSQQCQQCGGCHVHVQRRLCHEFVGPVAAMHRYVTSRVPRLCEARRLQLPHRRLRRSPGRVALSLRRQHVRCQRWLRGMHGLPHRQHQRRRGHHVHVLPWLQLRRRRHDPELHRSVLAQPRPPHRILPC